MFAAKENDKPLVLTAFFTALFCIAIPYLNTSAEVDLVNSYTSSYGVTFCDDDEQALTIQLTVNHETTTLNCGVSSLNSDWLIIGVAINFFFAFFLLMFNRVGIRYRFYIHLIGLIAFAIPIVMMLMAMLSSDTCSTIDQYCSLVLDCTCTKNYYFAFVGDGILALLAISWTCLRSFGSRKKIIGQF